MISLTHTVFYCKFSTKRQQTSNPVFDNWCTSCMYVCLLLLAYAWFWTCVRWHICSFFLYDFFKFFKICLVLITLYCLKTYCYKFDPYFFVLGRDRFFTVYICFKESLNFNFSYKLFNEYFSLPQSTSQFGVSVKK